MSCTGTSDCLCGCCSGISVLTPQGENNLPGLPAIAYRTGTWAIFKESMLARLSSAKYPALAGLKTRDNDDFSILSYKMNLSYNPEYSHSDSQNCG